MGARFVAAAMVLALAPGPGCGGKAPASPASTSAASQVVVAESAHFLLYFDGADRTAALPALEALDAAYDRVLTDLRPASMPRVSAYAWSSASTAYQNTMIRYAGAYYPGVTGFVGGPSELHVLLTSSVATNAPHEFVHCVSLALNPRFGNNPRWLWEAVALYENRQFVNPSALSYIKAGSFPTLSELNLMVDQSSKIYQVGYVLAEFIVERWGLEALRQLVVSNGNLETVLALDAERFQAAWREWVTARYLK